MNKTSFSKLTVNRIFIGKNSNTLYIFFYYLQETELESLQQQLRSIETEHQARVAAWKQQGGGSMQQDDAGGRRSRWDKTAPMGGRILFIYYLGYYIIHIEKYNCISKLRIFDLMLLRCSAQSHLI